ncbi:MAG: abortive infection protein [Nitrososphaerales archaeon]
MQRRANLRAGYLGLDVWLSPEMWDKSQDETLAYIAEASRAAESLRQKLPGKLVFSVGSELTLFMKGIVHGDNVFERLNNPAFWESVRLGKYNEPLNDFLEKANKTVRERFHGEVTYCSVPFERVKWSMFDDAGIDLYRDGRSRQIYDRMLESIPAFGKPVVIGEFGCCTYRGAELLGGNGFMIMFGMMKNLQPTLVLPKLISGMISVIPQVDGHYMRDEGLQAREVADQLCLLDRAGVEGAFVFTFVSPNSPYNDDPRFDSDMGSYSLVKSFAQKESVEEHASQAAKQGKALLGVELDPKILEKFGGNVGKHGETYPDMPWEPKESFKAVAEFYKDH